jgi:hypothetical protein
VHALAASQIATDEAVQEHCENDQGDKDGCSGSSCPSKIAFSGKAFSSPLTKNTTHAALLKTE